MEQSSFCRKAGEIRKAIRLLKGWNKPWAIVRLKIVTALSKNPEATDQMIARLAEVRTKVVTRLLEDLGANGTENLLRFGRPQDLTQKLQRELKVAINTIPLRSLEDVAKWLADEQRVGAKLSTPTLRAYCRKVGCPLPSRFKLPKQGGTLKLLQRDHWTARQKAELQKCLPMLGGRALALIEIGTTQLPVRAAARKYDVKVWRLYRDLNNFRSGRLRQAIAHTRGVDSLTALGQTETFYKWCDGQYAQNRKAPSAGTARNFLKKVCGVSLASRSVYRHMVEWKKSRNIETRTYKGVPKPP